MDCPYKQRVLLCCASTSKPKLLPRILPSSSLLLKYRFAGQHVAQLRSPFSLEQVYSLVSTSFLNANTLHKQRSMISQRSSNLRHAWKELPAFEDLVQADSFNSHSSKIMSCRNRHAVCTKGPSNPKSTCFEVLEPMTNVCVLTVTIHRIESAPIGQNRFRHILSDVCQKLGDPRQHEEAGCYVGPGRFPTDFDPEKCFYQAPRSTLRSKIWQCSEMSCITKDSWLLQVVPAAHSWSSMIRAEADHMTDFDVGQHICSQ